MTLGFGSRPSGSAAIGARAVPGSGGQPSEAVVPGLSRAGEPRTGLDEGTGRGGEVRLPAVTGMGDQASALEHAEVLGHRLAGDRQGGGQLCGREGTVLRDAAQHCSPSWVGEGLEHHPRARLSVDAPGHPRTAAAMSSSASRCRSRCDQAALALARAAAFGPETECSTTETRVPSSVVVSAGAGERC